MLPQVATAALVPRNERASPRSYRAQVTSIYKMIKCSCERRPRGKVMVRGEVLLPPVYFAAVKAL